MGSIETRQTVIVRSLWRGVVNSLRYASFFSFSFSTRVEIFHTLFDARRIDFTKDMLVLAALKDPHVARMIAFVEEEPFGAVFEYSELGDLPTFLEKQKMLTENETSFRLAV